jgi:hypothetical protein
VLGAFESDQRLDKGVLALVEGQAGAPLDEMAEASLGKTVCVGGARGLARVIIVR